MPGPRLLLPLVRGECSPFVNCTAKDAILNLIINSDLEEDGGSTMTCAQSSGSYVLMCKNLYENSCQVGNSPDAASLIQNMKANDTDSYGVLLIALIVCVILVMALVLSNLMLITKIRKAQKQSMKNEGDSEMLDELVQMKEQ
jgi:hypothetical protein